MNETVLNRVIENDSLIEELSLPGSWLGAKVELRIISPAVPRLPWNEIPRVKARTGRNSLDILHDLRAERV